jgi:hypothetical protein
MRKNKNLIEQKFFFAIIYALLLLTASFEGRAEAIQPSNIQTLSPAHIEKMRNVTWREGCPVSLNDLRVIHIRYWGFDQQTHVDGKLIVHKDVAPEIATIFAQLLATRFPIASIRPQHEFDGDDERSMEANNTSAFNCRAITGQPGTFSKHSYGTAIDINPLQNPYVKQNIVLPRNSRYLSRQQHVPGMISTDSEIVKLFKQKGWRWGGDWRSLKDYQHFERDHRIPKENR